ncbi:glycosyltransferase family 32 protein [Mixia osmundae IAM 14324]|uniref:Initiation-specific alpha-1,6-mannosyltransferase n=1 Tax=Mixia osmundae (strain CBS 9802 / IAM 14324 / JCM 22182 / KY 12970) TaxID=764103 RepID=G7E2J5_MIXOS|nr:glycosyltransferase family 32 protein [Mixia osmundae IAM 14324]KEI36927.1 glycosyltransferase family 32 protein [Mixia osmundae IAM 14324]GAA97055.1 hypothetical protein E5Q_03730 [Mixia osmundae IAM 14324]
MRGGYEPLAGQSRSANDRQVKWRPHNVKARLSDFVGTLDAVFDRLSRIRHVILAVLLAGVLLLALTGTRSSSQALRSLNVASAKSATSAAYEQAALSSAIKRLPFANITTARWITWANASAPSCPELGWPADVIYANLGSVDLQTYAREILDFASSTFNNSNVRLDSRASGAANAAGSLQTAPRTNDSIADLARQYFPLPNARSTLGDFLDGLFGWLMARPEHAAATNARYEPEDRIPHQLFQTGPTPHTDQSIQVFEHNQWITHNPGWTYDYFDDDRLSAWVYQEFGTDGLVARVWNKTAAVPVLRADIFRYMVIAKEGGIYTDTDTVCLKPVDDWYGPGDNDTRADEPPSMILGIEIDVMNRTNWPEWVNRPIQFSQWTIVAAPGHPILIDAMRRVLDNIDQSEQLHWATSSERERDICELTGPGPWTDAIMRYLLAKSGVVWSDLRDLEGFGRRFGDVLVLPVTSFNNGMRAYHSNSRDPWDPVAYVSHQSAGSWKTSHAGLDDT